MSRLVPHRLIAAALLALLSASASAAQATDSTGAARVTGMVRDSLTGRPLARALVQLVSDKPDGPAAQSVLSGTDGLFEFLGVADGRYTLGFHHALLDSLGLEPITRPLFVDGPRTWTVDLGTPSPARLRAALCGDVGSTATNGIVMGTVRRAPDGEPVPGAGVFGQWREVVLASRRVEERLPRRDDTSRDGGWYVLCNVPGAGTMALLAHRAADSTALIEVEVPETGFLRRDLWLGTARRSRVADSIGSTTTAGGAPSAMRTIAVGDGVVTGTVRSGDGDRPLAGVTVGLVDGPRVRTDAQGAFRIANAPFGTRLLEIRAVGHAPHQEVVDVLPGIPSVDITLRTTQAVIDAVRVTASRFGGTALLEFEERRKTAFGRFLNADEIMRRRPIVTTDIFRAFPGVFVDGNVDTDARVQMRGVYAERCEPTVFVNGSPMVGMRASDLNDFLKPERLLGVEVYQAGNAPPQFVTGAGECGSLVFWTRP